MEGIKGYATSGHMWIDCVDGNVPANAVVAGRNKDGTKVYAGRAYHEKDLLPAKIVANQKNASVCWGGKEHLKSEYEVFCGPPVAWQLANKGTIPDSSIPIGYTNKAEKLYFGRALYDGAMVPGKVQESHKTLYIPCGGKEVAVPEYEIMIFAP